MFREYNISLLELKVGVFDLEDGNPWRVCLIRMATFIESDTLLSEDVLRHCLLPPILKHKQTSTNHVETSCTHITNTLNRLHALSQQNLSYTS